MIPETDIELILRVLVALVATTVLVVIVVGLYRGRLTPRPLWGYAGVVVGLAAAWRWVIVWLGMAGALPEYAGLRIWIQPVNAALLAVVIFALGLLALAAIRGLR